MTLVQTLAGKQVVVAVTGSIAAVDIVRLIHELRRKGAVVQPVMSAAATGIIHPDALTYASGRETITRISGLIEHVQYCGDGGSADLLLVAPCTANTLGKVAGGIDDTPVTTFVTTAIGRQMPIVIVPAMHHSMYRHPAVTDNIAKLKSWGLEFVDPRIEEEKAKIAALDEIVLICERAVSQKPLKGTHVLITSGSCREPVDDIRILTTRSTGQMGRALALQAFRLGAEVTVVHRDRIPCVTNIFADTAEDMRKEVHAIFRKTGPGIYISAAAISDFAPVRIEGKIPSGKPVHLDLCPLPKLLDEVKEKYSPLIIAFKLGHNQVEPARKMIRDGASMVLVNTPVTMGSDRGSYALIKSATSENLLEGTKEEIASLLWEEILSEIEIAGKT